MRVYSIKARFRGLYQWGVGWVSREKKEAWDNYFHNLPEKVHSIFWGFYQRDQAQYLVGTSGSVYLHPMSLDAYLHGNVMTKEMRNGVWVEVFSDIEELKEILRGAAEACGGSVEFSDMAISAVEDPKWGNP